MKDTYSASRRVSQKPCKKASFTKPFLLTILLALICIGGMELAFCSRFAPALYHKITDPIVLPIQGMIDNAKFQLELRRFQRVRDSAAIEVSAGIREYYVSKPVIFPVPAQLPEPTAAPASSSAVTELITSGGTSVLTGEVPCVYYNQGDSAWRDKLFGSDPIGQYGCGPTAMSIVVESLTAHSKDPAQMAAWAYEQGYWCSGSGSYLSIIDGTCAAFGLSCVLDKTCNADKLYTHLNKGGFAVALVGPGHFTSSSGHFIVLRGAVSKSELLIADPSSLKNSLSLWDPELILKEAATSSGDGVCVWLISKPD